MASKTLPLFQAPEVLHPGRRWTYCWLQSPAEGVWDLWLKAYPVGSVEQQLYTLGKKYPSDLQLQKGCPHY